MSEEATVLTDEADGVLVITINRPEAKNAVNLSVAQGVAAALERLDSDDSLRVGVLTGAGGTFCAGMDLKAFVSGEFPQIEGRGFGGMTERSADKPLIAAVEGYALAVIDHHPAVRADTKRLNTLGEYRLTGEHMGARVLQISNSIDVKELGAGNTASEKLRLGVATVRRQIPGGVDNRNIGTLQLRGEFYRRYERIRVRHIQVLAREDGQ
jgi:hypothetical protein